MDLTIVGAEVVGVSRPDRPYSDGTGTICERRWFWLLGGLQARDAQSVSFIGRRPAMTKRAEGTPWILAVLVVTLSAIAAGGEEPLAPAVEITDPDTLVYARALGVDLSAMTKTSSGLYVQDLLVGDGEVAVSGDVLVVAYTNWLHDGARIDSSEFPNRGPYEFRLGVSPIIAGVGGRGSQDGGGGHQALGHSATARVRQ